MIATELQRATFSANHEREDAFFQVVQQYCPTDVEMILDLGCGDGSSTMRLAKLVSESQVIGIDLSPANIALANHRLSDEVRHIEFRACDYAKTSQEPVDVIVADTVLHLIEMPRVELFQKIGSELRDGGRLIFSGPKRCAFNKCLTLLRRMCLMFRSRVTDRLIQFVAHQLHGQKHDEAFLRERIEYMYINPRFFLSREFEQVLRTQCGLQLSAREQYPHTSMGQMRHEVWVCEKIA
jgi:2-polyprenyl-3-methyl-5-hydroxy-6-metoxy-1,4-benzoquinol methylase